MIDYGQTFKHLREQKGISITSAANGVVSKSFLSRFERGLSNISFEKLIHLLTNINVSAEELIYLAHCREQQPLEFHYEETKDYIAPKESANCSDKLEHYLRQYQRTKTSHDYLNYLKIKSHYDQADPLTTKQRQFIYTYLFKIETWTHYELRLFMATLDSFSTDQVFLLTKQMVKNGSETIDVNWNHQADFLYIILKAALMMALAGKEKELSTLIELAQQSIHNQQYLYEKSELHFLSGLRLCLRGAVPEGKQMVTETIQAFRTLDAPDLVRLYESYWRSFLTANPAITKNKAFKE